MMCCVLCISFSLRPMFSYRELKILHMLLQMDDDELLNLVMSRVACFAVPGQVIVRPSKMLRTRWSTDPFSLGAYSYWAVGNESGA